MKHRTFAITVAAAALLAIGALVAAAQDEVLYSFRAENRGILPAAGVVFDSKGNLYGTTSGGGANVAGTVFELTPSAGGAWTEKVLYSFGATSTDGIGPDSNLIFDAHGNLYGATANGGAYGGDESGGTVFELMPGANGEWTEKVLYSFGTTLTDGTQPGSVIFDAKGNLYGTTSNGGLNSAGTVFELRPSAGGGWTENVLYNFGFNAVDGIYPNPGLTFDTKGNLYGTTVYGGAYAAVVHGGTVFELTKAAGGWTESILYNLGDGANGAEPAGGLVFDALGNLYGMATQGGAGGGGTVFELTPVSGFWTGKVLYNFGVAGHDGTYPNDLLLDASGNLYGTTLYGGTSDTGTVFELTKSPRVPWTEKVLLDFSGAGPGGQNPVGLTFDGMGNLFGATTFGDSGTVFELTPATGGAWTEKVLNDFFVTGTDAYQPLAGLVFDGSGNLYGTANAGGANPGSAKFPNGAGAVFELMPGASGAWEEKLLHSFSFNGTDGVNPNAGLIFDAKGNLYGTTSQGGAYDQASGGEGTAFELTAGGGGAWNEKVLHSFGSTSADGKYPYAGLVVDAKGNLYGTTREGGANNIAMGGTGTVFELSPAANGSWTERVLHSFGASGTDGTYPNAGLIFDAAGNLYGTTEFGGGLGGKWGGGTVFELTPQAGGAWMEKVLYSFAASPTDGIEPLAGLVLDGAGNLYGTTYAGGGFGEATGGSGIVFRLSRAAAGTWTEKALYDFGGFATDGRSPLGGLILDGAGNLYGTTQFGGAYDAPINGAGTAFELSPPTRGNWKETVLESFGGFRADGQAPSAGLILDAVLNLYGTTSAGGDGTGGTVFEIQATTTAPPEFSPGAGMYTVAQTVRITDATPGAAIYYTTNGETPTTSSTPYRGPIDVKVSQTVKAIAAAEGHAESGVATAVYTIGKPVATPVFTPGGGTFKAGQRVGITDATGGAAIFYTLDGTTPTRNSTRYTGHITVTKTTTIKAIASNLPQGYAESAVATATYTIQ